MENAQPIAAADMAAPLLEMPKATVAPDAPTPAAAPAPSPAPAVKDSLGRSFDASKFAADSAGKPRFDTKGRFINANAGRKSPAGAPKKAPAVRSAPQSASFIPPETPAAQASAPQAPAEDATLPAAGKIDKYDLAADMYCRAAYGLAASALSDEWMPDDDSEHEALRASVAAYLRAKGEIDLSPGQALALAVLGYAGKRIPRPKTQARLSVFFQRVKDWFAGLRGMRRAQSIAAFTAPGGVS